MCRYSEDWWASSTTTVWWWCDTQSWPAEVCVSKKCVFVLQSGQFSEDMIPTVGFNMRKITKGNVTIKVGSSIPCFCVLLLCRFHPTITCNFEKKCFLIMFIRFCCTLQQYNVSWCHCEFSHNWHWLEWKMKTWGFVCNFRSTNTYYTFTKYHERTWNVL